VIETFRKIFAYSHARGFREFTTREKRGAVPRHESLRVDSRVLSLFLDSWFLEDPGVVVDSLVLSWFESCLESGFGESKFWRGSLDLCVEVDLRVPSH